LPYQVTVLKEKFGLTESDWFEIVSEGTNWRRPLRHLDIHPDEFKPKDK